jgi:AcrR family transcriptional regulator
VVEAALRVADEEGIDGLSLRRLAGELGVTPMSIYRHVRNKSHLLDLMAESLLEQIDLAPEEDQTWQERMRRLLGSYHAIVAAHPSMPLVVSRPLAVAPAERRAAEALLAIMKQAGFDAAQSARLMQVMAGMVLGPAIHRALWAHAEEEPSDADREEEDTEAFASEFPNLATVGPLIDWYGSADADRVTLDLLIGGLEALRRPSASDNGSGSATSSEANA